MSVTEESKVVSVTGATHCRVCRQCSQGDLAARQEIQDSRFSSDFQLGLWSTRASQTQRCDLEFAGQVSDSSRLESAIGIVHTMYSLLFGILCCGAAAPSRVGRVA